MVKPPAKRRPLHGKSVLCLFGNILADPEALHVQAGRLRRPSGFAARGCGPSGCDGMRVA